MTVLDDFRQKYPQYKDIPDGKLAYAIRKKYYADMDPTDFYRKAGLGNLIGLSDGKVDGRGSNGENFLAGMGKSVYDNARGAVQAGVGAAKLATLPTAIAAQALGTDNPVTDAIGSEYDKLKADQSQVNARDASLMGTKAGIAGNIVGQGAQAVAGGAALKAAGLGSSVIP
jgi:hypothetical protein